MRLSFQVLIAVAVFSGLAGVAWVHQRDDHQRQLRDVTRNEVHRFQQQIALRATLMSRDGEAVRFPGAIDLMWFDGDLPRNPLLDDRHPWIEVAAAIDEHLEHPPQRVASHSGLAKYWYNPANGTVRARVPAAISDHEAIETYNHINGCEITALFELPPSSAKTKRQ